MTLILPPLSPNFKQIQHYLKAASEHEARDRVVTYWCRLYALQTALKIDKRTDEDKALLLKLMDWLEQEKKAQSDNEAVTNDIAAQAHVENYSLKLFMWADGQDRSAIFNKNVVKAFYTAGILMDVLSIFGEQSEDIVANCKYAKWKAAYIHNCLKNGETPVPGPVGMGAEEDEGTSGFANIPGASFGDASKNLSDTETPFQPLSSSGFVPTVLPNETPQPNAYSDVSPYTPTPSSAATSSGSNGSLIAPGTGAKLDPSQVTKAQKYCKFAASALNYDDVNDAINYLQKALKLLETGQEI